MSLNIKYKHNKSKQEFYRMSTKKARKDIVISTTKTHRFNKKYLN